ncbi:hypothetical protein ACJX0J_009255, partial [Zea mays]
MKEIFLATTLNVEDPLSFAFRTANKLLFLGELNLQTFTFILKSFEGNMNKAILNKIITNNEKYTFSLFSKGVVSIFMTCLSKLLKLLGKNNTIITLGDIKSIIHRDLFECMLSTMPNDQLLKENFDEVRKKLNVVRNMFAGVGTFSSEEEFIEGKIFILVWLKIRFLFIFTLVASAAEEAEKVSHFLILFPQIIPLYHVNNKM